MRLTKGSKKGATVSKGVEDRVCCFARVTLPQSFWGAIWKFLFKSKKHTDCSYLPSCFTSGESTSNRNTRRFDTTLSHVEIKHNPNVHLRKEL